jgi:signal transduction histidine kinase
MPLKTLIRTSVFRLTLGYMALFGASAIALFAFIYWSTLGVLQRQTNAVIEAEIDGLAEQYERRGIAGLADIINERVARDEEHLSVYLLADAIGQPIAGNVSYWPRNLGDDADWVDFVHEHNGIETPVRAKVLRVAQGFRLLVGRDVREIADIDRVLRRASVYGLTLTMGLSLLVGFLMAVSSQRRLAELNRTTRQIMAGDLHRRAPIGGGHDEHDELAANINAMLDQIESLLEGMRHVGDSVAHDLRSPLTRLRNRLETLAAAEQPRREDLLDCAHQLDHVLDTFNALLRIARVESGAHRAAFAAVDLGRIVTDVCELYQAAADTRQLELHCNAATAVEVLGDRELLAQALTNLLDNAIKYTPSGGSVTVTLECTDDRAKVSIADSGPGIPAADHERVLQRFTRLDRSRSLPGNGLGLALVKAVATQHHGKLILGDNAPGLIVTLELPALAPTRQRAAMPTAAAEESRVRPGETKDPAS